MKIKQVSSVLQLSTLIKIASFHSAVEYTCSFDEFANYLVSMYYSKSCNMYLAVDGNKPIGYLILTKSNSVLSNELHIFDVFVIPEYQGKGVFGYFIKQIDVVFRESGAEKVCWNSDVLPKKFFERYSPIPIYEKKMYYATKKDYEEMLEEN